MDEARGRDHPDRPHDEGGPAPEDREGAGGEPPRDAGAGEGGEADEDCPDTSAAAKAWRGSLDVRSISLLGLFVLAILYTLSAASPILLPLTLAALLAMILAPLARRLELKFRIPPWLTAATTLLVLLAVLVAGAYTLSGPVARWFEEIPEVVREVERDFQELFGRVARVQEAGERVEEMAAAAGGGGEDEALPVRVQQRGLVRTVLDRAQGLVAMVALTLALLFFLLASGDLFLRKLVRILPTFHDKRQAVAIVHQIQTDISVYLLTITIVNVGLGVAIGIAMYLWGLPNAVLWGVMATVFNFVPYLGAIVGIVVVCLVTLVTYEGAGPVLGVAITYYGLTALEGNFVTPMVLGQRLTLNPVVIFFSLIFWGWIWGIPGALIAIPLMAAVKIILDRIEATKPLGELLGT